MFIKKGVEELGGDDMFERGLRERTVGNKDK
jgi:hypothetical protein